MSHMPSPPRPSDRVIARVRRRLAERIEETGIPIARLARRAGVSKVTVHRILGDAPTNDFFVGTLANLADALLIDVHVLFEPLPDEVGGANGHSEGAAPADANGQHDRGGQPR